ncbi:MAG: hypothetical protein ACW981_19560 [Candidatus Hodarchaeales archaeon]|jgi:hypothetical protein
MKKTYKIKFRTIDGSTPEELSKKHPKIKFHDYMPGHRLISGQEITVEGSENDIKEFAYENHLPYP